MESRKKKSDGVGISKGNRSLDLKSLYESRIPVKGNSKNRVSSDIGQEGVKGKKRKSKSEVPLSCFESDPKKSRKEDLNSVKSHNGFKKKSSSGSKGLHGALIGLGDDGGFNIPKRPRGSVGWKKLENDLVDQVEEFKSEAVKPDNEGGENKKLVQSVTVSVDKNGVLNPKSGGKVFASKSKSKQKTESKSATNPKQEVGADEAKGSRKISGSAHCLVKEYDASSGDPSVKKWRNRKKKNLVKGLNGGEASVKKHNPSVVGPVSGSPSVKVQDDEDDDEENLEQNAARMLSSRFDPSCTGFSSKRKSSESSIVDEFSLRVSSGAGKSSGKVDLMGGGKFASTNAKSRTLRPRREDKGKSLSRPRRHFYDIPPVDFDPYWVLHRRIKIFWPLDESWYFGLVNDYNSETKLHHIKYDDYDEEWVNIVEEKFKLLLLPNEVPGKAKSRHRLIGDKDVHLRDIHPPDDNSHKANYLDSEPIGSWLASQSQRAKTLPKTMKRQRTSQEHLPSVSSLSLEKTSSSNGNVVNLRRPRNGHASKSDPVDNIVAHGRVDKSLLPTTSPTQSDVQMVYVRKKYRKKNDDVIACASATRSVIPHMVGKKLFSLDAKGDLRLNNLLLGSIGFRFDMCLHLLPFLEFLCGVHIFQLLHDTFVVQNGTIVASSPAVILEMLFVDNNVGLRFFLFDGCLKQALAFLFLILFIFSQPVEYRNGNFELPMTSIRFQLSSPLDRRRQHAFEFYSFSILQCPNWLSLNSMLLQHCLLIKHLPLSECTYDNMKELERGISLQFRHRSGLKLFSYEGFKNIFAGGVSPIEDCREVSNSRINQPTSSMVIKPGKVPQFSLSVSAAPTFFLTLHLKLLLENSFASVNLEHQDALLSSQSRENGGQLAAPRGQSELNSVTLQGFVDVTKKLNNKSPNRQDLGMVAGLAGRGTEKIQTPIHPPRSSERDRVLGCMPVDGPSPKHVNSIGFVHNHKLTGPRSSWRDGRNSISSPLGHQSPAWQKGNSNFMTNGFGDGPKKPRTPVQYTLPFVAHDFNAKQKLQNSTAPPCKRIRRASLKRISDGSGNSRKKLELLTCVANLLITNGNKGWRECGVHIVLEASDRNEWTLAVKRNGVTKYSYKIKHILQPGSTNRYTHAIMWKGGKDWVLEFPDRSQWTLFKEMHEECYNRNLRAASVKNIPIPGVWLVEEGDDYGTDVPFVRNSTKYFRQGQTDVEMATDSSRILYDLDSDDEQWLSGKRNCPDNQKYEEISEDSLEKAIDLLEKISYSQKRVDLTNAEIEELGIGSMETSKLIYEHWRQKRDRFGMPLLRHLQPPLWEKYQKQLKVWEQTVAQGNYGLSVSSQEKAPPPEKPPMFAFCLRPRGLDVTNKAPKQRPHRRMSVSGHHHTPSGYSDSLLAFGRRRQGYSDFSPSLWDSTQVLSPRDWQFSYGTNAYEWKDNPRVSKKKAKKLRPHSSFHKRRNGNGKQQWNMDMPEFSNQRHYYTEGGFQRPVLPQLEGLDLDELRLRDASSAAKRALHMAKFKREKAQKLMYRADLAIHKAVIALMTAEAIKESSCNSVDAI